MIANEVDEGLTKVEFLLSKIVHDLRTINKSAKIEVDSSSDITDDGETLTVSSMDTSGSSMTIMGLFAESVANSSIGAEHKEAIVIMANELYAEAIAS